jgi:hypothetical protein
VTRVSGDGLFGCLTILLTSVSYYFLLRYLIADAERVLCCAEYSHYIH